MNPIWHEFGGGSDAIRNLPVLHITRAVFDQVLNDRAK